MRALRLGATALVTALVAAIAVAVYVADEVTRVDRAPLTRSHLLLAPTAEPVSFHTADGLTLRGWFVPASREKAAVLVHGKDTNRLGSDHTLRVARWLRDAGYSLLLFDMRGHGESDGDRFSLGQHERKDVAAAVDVLVGFGFPPGRIVLVGESMGAAVAIQGVALRPDVAAVVADSAYADGPSIVDEAGPGETGLPDWYTAVIVLAARVLFGLDAGEVDPAAVVRANPRVPFLSVHCDGDTLIDPHHARDLRAASANAGTRLWMATGCGHVGASARYPDEYRSQLIGFLDAQLR
ncbi:MAG: alpha/beta fold hydrolase [Chloroflexi bacterium]|nr:alpha/beta fold hydrolase [Chloroflexota bacterium]